MQPSGSFKIRYIHLLSDPVFIYTILTHLWDNSGVGHMCIKAVELRGPSIHFVTAAGVNTCLAVAYSARQLNVDATIVLPKYVNEKIFEMIKLEGAHLIIIGEVSLK